MTGRASRRTIVIGCLLIAATVATAFGVSLGNAGTFGEASEAAVLWFADIGTILVTGGSAIVTLVAASRFEHGESFRRYWMLIGAGLACYALGDIIWALYELRGFEPPYPGWPDAAYLAEYVFIASGMLIAGLGYRQLVDTKRPAFAAAALGLFAAAGIWFGLLGPYIWGDPELAMGEKLLSTAYPLFDVFFAFVPAAFLALVVGRLGGGRLARPWLWVGAGMVLLAISDTAYSWMSAQGTYESGVVIDYGWMLAAAFVAIGARVARDLAHPG